MLHSCFCVYLGREIQFVLQFEKGSRSEEARYFQPKFIWEVVMEISV